jgi:Zn-dependent peptidase ImmA (M78 family)/transcriptional regulator with XRE-family HTH domain
MFSEGGLLRVARQFRKLDQKDVAARLGLSPALISRLENGIVSPPDELRQRLAHLFDVPVEFLQQNEPVYGTPLSVHTPMWRKKTIVTAAEIQGIVAELNIRVMHLRRLGEEADVEVQIKVPRLDPEVYGGPEAVAGMLRRQWLLPEGPIRNLVGLVESAGIVVVHSDMGGSQVAGVTYAVPGLPRIVMINRNDPADRQRYTLAHELGHIVMHDVPSPEMEDQANEFASFFLVPRVDLKRTIAGRKINLSLLGALKREWRVSMAALLMAIAKRDRLIPPETERYLWIEFSRRNIKINEPPEFDFPVERPSAISSMIEAFIKDLGYTPEDLRSLFRLHSRDIQALYGLESTGKETRPPDPGRARLRLVI